MPAPLAAIGADDACLRLEAVGAHPEHPLGLAELGLHRTERPRRALVAAIEVPPAAAVRDEVEDALGRPLGLEDRLLGPAGHELGRRERAVAVELGAPQRAAVPRHVGVVPGEPGQAPAIGAEARRGVEIAARDQHPLVPAAVEGHGDDGVEGLGFAVPVVFAHTDQPPARGVDHRVGVAAGAL